MGWIASAVPAAWYVFESGRLGLPRSETLPPGYALVLVAAAAFGGAGMFDLVWHATVGEIIWAAMGQGALGGRDERRGYWLIGFAVPATQFFLYFAIMAAFGGGIVWSTPLWSGAPILAGLYGLIASGLAIPPRFVSADEQHSAN